MHKVKRVMGAQCHCICEKTMARARPLPEIDCGEPPQMSNTTITREGTTVGKTATYSCHPLTTFMANTTNITCGEGDKAHYTCSPLSYFYANSTSIQCGVDGRWSDVSLQCTVIDCGKPPDVQNPIATSTAEYNATTVGSTAHYKCQPEKYFVATPSISACGQYGQWEPVICDNYTCPTPSGAMNAKVEVEVSGPLCKAVYECKEGFERVKGNTVRFALGSEEWSCGMPPLISHASVFVTEYTYNSEATYNCSYSYRKTGGSNKKLCSSDRTWVGQNIVCEKMVCPVPAQIPNTTVEYKSLEWGGYAHYICKEGMVRTRDSVNVIYCQDNGTWEQATMKCHELSCGILEAPGLVPIPSSSVGTAAKLQCRHGFSGHEMIINLAICKANGQWSQVPVCIEMVCDLPRVNLPLFYVSPRQAAINVSLDAVVRYGCEHGFYLYNGHENRTCLSNGLLDGVQPKCERVVCPPFELPPFLNFASVNTSVDGSLSFACDTGFNLSHLNPLVCSDVEKWIGNVPECLRLTCDVPPRYPNTTRSYSSLEYDSIVTYVTEEGYEFEDESSHVELTCSSNAQWQGNFPGVRMISCGDLSMPVMTSIEVTTTTLGSQVFYRCEDVTSLVDGNNVRECLANGSWSGHETQCAELPESELEDFVNDHPSTENYTRWQLALKSWGFTESDLQADHYAIGLSSIGLCLIPLILLLCIDLPHYRKDYKRLFKRNVKSYWRHLRRKTHSAPG
ncbi:hypothetical protein CAPTEDRAFT_202069 [Capitella teleta]|uniref:Sushi domain-containing protein n=1 Tax=Capitella teleta TaxID=283909 RepID=R7TB82_CAPTE|nr:hypothetical protein CAPTEDRAFT_202069 [Capitella teleta]|eukprot:ELT88722.1 hypothetical protein CAPTEDRAFT_202069 [Capitella teleta]